MPGRELKEVFAHDVNECFGGADEQEAVTQLGARCKEWVSRLQNIADKVALGTKDGDRSPPRIFPKGRKSIATDLPLTVMRQYSRVGGEVRYIEVETNTR